MLFPYSPARNNLLLKTLPHNERLRGGATGALDCPVDRGSDDAEEFSDLRGGVFASLVDLDQVLLLSFGQLGLLTAQPTGRFGDLHPFARACSDQVGLDSATIASTLKRSLPTGSVGA